MMQGLHPPFPSLSGAAICASALEEMDEETDRLLGGKPNRQLLLHTPNTEKQQVVRG